MVGSDADEAVDTEATNRRKLHNASCVKSREKKKRRFEALEKVETEYNKMVPEFNHIKAEHERATAELEQQKSKMLCTENHNQELRRALEEQGRTNSSLNEWIELYLLSTNEQVGQGSGNFATVLPDANQIVGLGTTGHQMNFGQDYTNITASAVGRPSSVANHDFLFGLEHDNNNLHSHGLAAGNQAGVLNSAAGSSFAANHDLSVLDAPNNHDNLSTHNPAAGVLSSPAAGSFFGANPSLPILFDSTNNQ